MDSSSAGIGSAAAKSDLDRDGFAEVSSIRQRILEESKASNRTKSKAPRKQTWTKKAKYEGYQSTLDLSDGLKPLRSATGKKSSPPEPQPVFAWSSTDHDDNDNDENMVFGDTYGDPYATNEDSARLDPVMIELDGEIHSKPLYFFQTS
jgi:hypothetical protein